MTIGLCTYTKRRLRTFSHHIKHERTEPAQSPRSALRSRLMLADLFVVDNSQGWRLPWGNTEQGLGYTAAQSVQIQTLFQATTHFSLALVAVFQWATSSIYRCSRETFRSSAELGSKNKNVYANTNVRCPVNWSIKINICGWPFAYAAGLWFHQKGWSLHIPITRPVFYHSSTYLNSAESVTEV
jgi:hypothetical protein